MIRAIISPDNTAEITDSININHAIFVEKVSASLGTVRCGIVVLKPPYRFPIVCQFVFTGIVGQAKLLIRLKLFLIGNITVSRTFRLGRFWGAASYLQIMASELSDKLLLELLELDAEMTVTLHVQTVDQLKAIKMTKGKISDIDKMKVEEQKKAVRAGYDMEILPPDLITYSKDAAALLADLQSRNERMFLLTFTVVNIAPTRQKLGNDVFTISGIAQKYNCALKRLDWQQEQGFTSSLVLGGNAIEIQRGMTTSSTAIFIPFMTKELRMDGAALWLPL